MFQTAPDLKKTLRTKWTYEWTHRPASLVNFPCHRSPGFGNRVYWNKKSVSWRELQSNTQDQMEYKWLWLSAMYPTLVFDTWRIRSFLYPCQTPARRWFQCPCLGQTSFSLTASSYSLCWGVVTLRKLLPHCLKFKPLWSIKFCVWQFVNKKTAHSCSSQPFSLRRKVASLHLFPLKRDATGVRGNLGEEGHNVGCLCL